MKLLSLAIWTASLTEMVVRPLLRTTCVDPDGDCVVSAPSSLQRSTGSMPGVSFFFVTYEGVTDNSAVSN
jgi:hypothetical protein